MTWWDSSYPFRRNLRVTASTAGLPEMHPGTVTLDATKLVDLGKVNDDYDDLAVVYNTTQLGRDVTRDGDNLYVEFEIQTELEPNEVIDDAYYVYYGNTTPSAQPAYTSDPWPISVNNDGVTVSYTRPDEYWIDGVSDVQGARAVFTFAGARVRLVSNTGPHKGIAEVQVDNQDWENADLYSTTAASNQVVYENTDLLDGRHTLRVRVSGEKNPSSTGTSVNVVRFDYRRTVDVIDLGEQLDDLVWSSSLGGS